MDEGGPFAIAHVLNRLAQRPVTGQVVGSIAAEDAKPRKTAEHARDVPRGSLHLHRDRDRIPVVFYEIQNGKLLDGGGTQRFPELTFTGPALTNRDVSDLVR